MVYIIMSIFLMILSGFEVLGLRLSNKLNKFLVIFVGIIFLFLSSVRWERGTDWIPYYEYFNFVNQNIHSIDLLKGDDFEIGYEMLNYLIAKNTSNYTIFLFFLGLIILFFQTGIIFDNTGINLKDTKNLDDSISNKKNYPLTMLFIIWGFYIGNIFPVRNTIAVLISLFAVKYIRKKEFIKFFISVIVSSLFHRTGIFYLMAYPIYHLKLNKVNKLYIFIGFIILYLFLDDITIYISSILGGEFENRALSYLSQNNGKFISLGMIRIVFSIIFYTLIYNTKVKDSTYKGHYNLYLFGVIIYISSLKYSLNLTRLSDMFRISEIVLLPYIFRCFNNKSNKLIVFSIFSLYILISLYVKMEDYWQLYIPFKSIFNMDLNVEIY